MGRFLQATPSFTGATTITKNPLLFVKSSGSSTGQTSSSAFNPMSVTSTASPISGSTTGLLAGLLGFDIQQNLNNVFKYGLSSWGASTNPEAQMQKITSYMNPIIQGKVNQLTKQNAAETLSYLDSFLAFMYIGHKYLRKHHARAGSTKKAYEQAMEFLTKLRKSVIDDLVSKLRDSGYTVSHKTVYSDQVQLNQIHDWHNGNRFGSKSSEKVAHKVFAVQAPIIGGNDIEDTVIDENGNVTTKPNDAQNNSGSGNTLVWGGIAYGAAKLLGLI